MSAVNTYNTEALIASSPLAAGVYAAGLQRLEEQKRMMSELNQKMMASIPQRLANYSQYSTVATQTSSNPYGNYGNYNYGAEKNVSKTGNGYGKEFLDKVKQIAQRLNCDYKDLLGVMNAESGINAKARNRKSSATGLIQFMESTAKAMGTSTAALAAMSPVQQLDYVEKCIKMSKKMAGIPDSQRLSAGDLYALIFLPARAKQNVIARSGDNYYAANRGLDLNKDGVITKDELGQRVVSKRVSDNSFLA